MMTPEPRLPLEPEEYPMYQPPRRLGCSGLSVVTLIMLFIFAFLFLRVTPAIVEGFKSLSNNSPSAATDQGTPLVGSDDLNLATQTVPVADAAPTSTLAPISIPTVQQDRVCRKVQNTDNGLRLREKPDASLPTIVLIPNGTSIQLLEPEVTPVKDNQGRNWKQVRLLPPDSRVGYVQSDYLTPVDCP